MSSSIISSLSAKLYSGFDPRTIANCALWFDAADTSSITGTSTVTNWRSKGTINVSATNLTGSCTSGNTINGLNYINFPEGTELAFTTTLNTQARSWFVVMRAPSGTPLGKEGGVIRSELFSLGVNYNTNSLSSLVVSRSLSPFIAIRSYVTTSTLRNLFVASLINSTTTSSNIITLNGTSQTLSNSESANYQIANTTFRIGAGSGNLNLDIMEILFYYEDLTSLQRQQIEGYLSKKWGVLGNLPTTHIYKNILLNSRPTIPSDNVELVLWLDAADGNTLTLTGSNVTGWRDKSGYGYNATPQVGGTTIRPTFANNAVNFVGTSLLNTTLPNTLLTQTTYFIVGSVPTTTSQVLIAGNVPNGSTNRTWFIAISNGNQRTSAYGDTEVNLGGAITSNVRFIYNGTLVSAGTSNMFLNGTLTNTKTGTLTYNGVGTTTIGGYIDGSNPNGAARMSGSINEVIIYRGVLTIPQIQQIEGYLAKKWSSASLLPSVHPFKLYPPMTLFFIPTIFQSCNLWYDAADLTTITYASGSSVNVSGLRDKSPTGNNLTRSYTPGFEIATINKQNGLTVLSFPRNILDSPTTDTYLTSTTSLTMSSSVNYCFFVMRFGGYVYGNNNTPREYPAILPFDIGVTNGVGMGLIRLTTPSVSWRAAYFSEATSVVANSEGVISTSSSGPITPTPLLCMVGKSSNTVYEFSINGTYETKTVTSASQTGGQPVNVGKFFTGQELCEMIVLSGTILSKNDIQEIEGYLAWKWGLQSSLPISHAYSRFPP